VTTFRELNEIHVDAPGGVLPVLARTLSACDYNTMAPAHYVAVLAAVGFLLAFWPLARCGHAMRNGVASTAGHVSR